MSSAPAKHEPEHIRNGRLRATTLSESDVRDILAAKIQYMIERNADLDCFRRDAANMGGTFGNFYGWWDSGSPSRPHIEVKLADGRTFTFSKSDMYGGTPQQVSLL